MSNERIFKLEQVLLHKRISAYELSKMTGLSQGYISKIRNGKESPTLRNVILIAEALDVCVCVLIACNCDKCKKGL